MEKENNNNQQENVSPSLLVNYNSKGQESPRKQIGSGGGSNNNDRLKRDEWSEGAVSCLLEAYEAKWVLRNRAKLKGHDWEEVASHVSARANNTKSPKTQTQCKNKIESMKKRYRSESANADGSSWLLYPRLHLLLRGNNNNHNINNNINDLNHALQQQHTLQPQPVMHSPPPLIMFEPPMAQPPPPPPPQPHNSHSSNGTDIIMAKEDGDATKLSDHVSDKKVMDTDSSTPVAALYSDREKLRSKQMKMKKKMRRRKREEWEIAESIRWLAEVVAKSEQTRMETMREIEKMRAEAEAKRGELDLKRTEIIANTQLEIAKLFAAANAKDVDSSLRVGRN